VCLCAAVVAVFVLLCNGAPLAQPSSESEREGNMLFCIPGTYTGTLGDADYKIIFPHNWNGVLVVYVHGYSYTVPPAQATFANPYWPANTTTSEDILLAEGYALAGSSFSAGGWAVAEAMEDTDRLTRAIANIAGFNCRPRRTILFGVSLGSLTALTKAETHQSWFWPLYDGVVSGCSIGAGASRTVDLSLQFNLAFSAAFADMGGWPAAWGTPQAINPEIEFYYQVEPYVGELLSNQLNFGRFEFQRLVSVLSEQDYYPWSPPPSDISLFLDFFFSTQALAELQARAGGKVTGNVGRTYALPDAAKAYLAQFGVDADVMLAYMNSNTNYVPDPQGAAYVRKYADFNGHLKVPVLTMHTSNDGLIPTTSDTFYRGTVAKAGRLSHLHQVFTTSSGHCNFSPQQVVRAIKAMDQWLRGRRPTPADFPVAEGFQPPDYSPGPWPYGN